MREEPANSLIRLKINRNDWQYYNTCALGSVGRRRNKSKNPTTYTVWRHDWSSHLYTRKAVVKWKPAKKFRPERDSSPWPLRYRCSALPTELSSHWELVSIAEVIGSNPQQAWIVCRLKFHNCLSCVCNCDVKSLSLYLSPQFKYVIFHIMVHLDTLFVDHSASVIFCK